MVESLNCDNRPTNRRKQTTLSAIKMLGTPYMCAFYVATAGLQGASLGSDEEEIVLLIYVIIDMVQNKIVGLQQYIVKPSKVDTKENDESVPILSEQVTTETSLTDDLIKNSGVPLETAIKQFDSYVKSLNIDSTSPLFRLVTDGQLPLRQCLHPEACSKNIELPEYYNVFHDLRKDFRTFYNVPNDQELSSITHLVKYVLDLGRNIHGIQSLHASKTRRDEKKKLLQNDLRLFDLIRAIVFKQIGAEIRDLRMTHTEDPQFPVAELKDMINIIQRLIADGHCFSTPEKIQLKLEPGICWKDEEVDNNCVVRARGLPWQSSDLDIAKFFRGLNVAKGGVALCLSQQGRRNGEALVRFINQEHRDMALKRHKHHLNDRYIETYKASGADFVNVAGGNNNEAQAFLTKGAQAIVRMRGLPYDCTAKQVIEFFEGGNEENSCKVMDGEDGVLFVKKPDGRATGDAFVLFANEDDVSKALSKHRESIGTRYIELFRSTTAEVQQVLNRTMETAAPSTQVQTVPYAIPQHVITSGTRKDCIRLRGLPYEASVEHVLEFLGEHAKNILLQGVHMVYNSQGHPSGEAFIQMDSEHSAFAAAQMRHHRFMIFGKKQRYIEVFQCSGEDMSHVLFGGLTPSQTPLSPVGKPLLSPGMLNTPTLLPTPANHPAALTAAAAAAAAIPPNAVPGGANQAAASAAAAAHALIPQQSALAWDPFSSAAVALQMQQAALAQAQAQAQYRSQTENAWVMNQLAAQQQLQMQLAALANAQKVGPWGDISAAAAAAAASPALITLPPPPLSQVVQTTQASSAMSNANKPKPPMIPSSAVYPGSNALHIPQAASIATTAPQPFVLINLPRFTSPVQSSPYHQHHPKVTGITSTSTVNQAAVPSAAFHLSSNSLIASSAQYAASSILKRSWEHAFPDSLAAAQNASGVSVKRPYSIANVANSAGAIFTMPPPQQPAAQIASQPSASAVAFQQAPFFAPT